MALPAKFLVEKLIVHHSWSPDNKKVNDWDSIRKYHMSWRFDGEIIPEEKAKELLGRGIKGVEPPWMDIGYHAGQEWVNGKLIRREGRPELRQGAHCLEKGMNFRSLGYCFIGCFDKIPPTEQEMQFAAEWFAEKIKQYGLPGINCIEPHHKYAGYKSCPGEVFPVNKLKFFVSQKLHS